MPLSTQAAMRKDKQTSTNLQHRNFAFIAQTIAGIADANQRYAVAYHFALACRSTNKNFDHDRFMRACNAISVACQPDYSDILEKFPEVTLTRAG